MMHSHRDVKMSSVRRLRRACCCRSDRGAASVVISIHPQRIPGRWRQGYALDIHTEGSIFLGHDEFGRPRFDTKRSEAGDLLYRLKYQGDQTAVADLIEAASAFIHSKGRFDYDQRWRLLADLHEVDRPGVQGKRILLFDDLFRSGATMNSVAAALYEQGGVADIFALTVTRTRSKQ